MGVLYVVATPIGNLQDMTPRAIETLRQVGLIAAEDTRHSGRLLQAFGIATPMVSYHQHNRASREAMLLDRLRDQDVALISDAGTPAVADPGADLVAAVLAAGHRVVPIPGASSLVAAVSASGLVSGPFLFLGFLPRPAAERRRSLAQAAVAGVPVVLFESPLRLAEALRDLAAALGERRAVVARELTKLHEEIVPGSLPDLAARFAGDPPRGEIVIVIEGAPAAAPDGVDDVDAIARRLLAEGLKPSRAARELAALLGLPGNEAYDIVRRAVDTP